MRKVRHVDNTLARHPPGGKVHYLDADEADKLPSEVGRRKPARSRTGKTTAGRRKASATRKTATSRKTSASRKTSGARKSATSRKTTTGRKTTAKKRSGRSSVSIRKVAKAEK